MASHWSTFSNAITLRAAMAANSRTYVNTPWRHEGRDRNHSLDCLGLLISNARDFGFSFELAANDDGYSLDPNGYQLVERLSQEMHLLDDWRQAKPGDVLLQRFHVDRPPQHVGLVTRNEPDNVHCVHSSRKVRRCAETRWDREDLITHAFVVNEVWMMETMRGCCG